MFNSKFDHDHKFHKYPLPRYNWNIVESGVKHHHTHTHTHTHIKTQVEGKDKFHTIKQILAHASSDDPHQLISDLFI